MVELSKGIGVRTKGDIVRQVLIYPDEDNFFVAEVPSLPGCISQGKTRPEAIKNIREAIKLYIETLIELGRPIPDDELGAALVIV